MKSEARRSSRLFAGCSRSPSGTHAHGRLVLARDRFGIKPLYYRVADGTVSFASELKALLRQPGFSREIDPEALESFLAFNSIPSPLTIFNQARKLPPGHLLVAERGEVTDRALRAAVTRARGRGAHRERRRAGRGAPRAAPGLGPRAPGLRRARRCPALRRRRLRRAHGDGGSGERLSGEHVLDRVRGELVRRARPGAPGGRALRDRPPRAGAAAGRRRAAAEAGRGLRRALRRLLGAPHIPRLAARRGHGQGGALRGGRGRALRRLLHLRGRSARAAGGQGGSVPPAPRRAAAELLGEGELRLQGQALHARRPPAAGRAPSRLEGDLLAGVPGGAAQRAAHL